MSATEVEYPGGFADAPGLIDIGANRLTFVSQYGGQYGTGEVNRYVLTFSGLGRRAITGFGLDGESSFAPRLSGFTGNSVFFDVAGQFPENGTAIYNIDVAVVPEPSSWALMISGFGLAGAAMRRKAVYKAALA